LQDALLIEADGQMASHWKTADTIVDKTERSQYLVEQLVEVIKTTLVYLPAEMWTILGKSESRHKPGREETRDLFEH